MSDQELLKETIKEGEEENDNMDEPRARDPLSLTQIRAYTVGHFNNDLCASMWFIYLNYYLLYVVGLT